MRLRPALAALAALTFSGPALAGGVGVFAAGGMHTETVYFYDQSDAQFQELQVLPTYGFGFQGILGDRDDRVVGLMKFYYLGDTPPSADVSVGGDFNGPPVLAVRDDTRHIGLASAGIQWGLVGDPNEFQLNLITSMGAGVLTADSTEFIQVEVGPGVHYHITDELQLNGELVYDFRWRKGPNHNANVNVGIRYLFD